MKYKLLKKIIISGKIKAETGLAPLYDFNATILHLLGLNHERLTFEHNGIQRRLTNVEGNVIREMLA